MLILLLCKLMYWTERQGEYAALIDFFEAWMSESHGSANDQFKFQGYLVDFRYVHCKVRKHALSTCARYTRIQSALVDLMLWGQKSGRKLLEARYFRFNAGSLKQQRPPQRSPQARGRIWPAGNFPVDSDAVTRLCPISEFAELRLAFP